MKTPFLDWRAAAQSLLLLAAAVSAAILASRAAFGASFTPMNLETVCSGSLLLLILFRSRTQLRAARPLAVFWPLIPIAVLTLAAFAPFLSFPFVADDYAHIWHARHFTMQAGLDHLTRPDPDRFFRPLVYLAYAAEAPLAQLNPTFWRAAGLAWHTAGAFLIYELIRRLRASTLACFAGAAVFALSGTRPEAVTWVGAQFDLMATVLGLAALVLLLRGRTLWSTVMLVAAVLSKESAYMLPFIAAVLLVYDGLSLRVVARRLWPWFAAAAVVFVYRLALLHGIGGYQNPAGTPTVLNLGPRTLYGLILRSWDVMLFPLNWTHIGGGFSGIVIGILLALAMASLAWLAWNQADRAMALAGIAFFLLAAVPVHQFLPVGADLEKARVLYLPSAGFSILLASLFRGKAARAALVPVLAFQFAALMHNLSEWRAVGELAGRTCAEIATRLDRSPEPIALPPFPNVVHGVYFLKTGYPECVWLLRPERQKDVTTLDVTPLAGRVK